MPGVRYSKMRDERPSEKMLDVFILTAMYLAAAGVSPGPVQTESRTCAPQVAVCPPSCTCNNNIVDCRRKGLTEIPANLPEGIVEM